MPKSYKRNYLSSVIFRLDFFQDIAIGELREYSKKIKSILPIREEKEGVSGMINLDFTSGDVRQASRKISTWLFSNKNKNKKLEVGLNYIYLEYTNHSYKNSLELLSDINALIFPFLESYEIGTARRVGLRYTNEINLNEKNPLDWSKYINKKLIGGLDFGSKKIARSMGQVILKEENGDLVFNFGMWNKDYPNQILNKEFILDFDCYSNLGISRDKIIERVKEYNNIIEGLFEDSITDNFRKILNK